MIKFYSSHCPKCAVLEDLMKNKKIEFELIDNEKEYLPVAKENNIMSMPFAEIDGKFYNSVEFQKWVMGYKNEV